VTATKLKSMNVTLDEDLAVAMILRGLPPNFEHFTSSVRHREKMPTLN
jgi:hypothetical protein